MSDTKLSLNIHLKIGSEVEAKRDIHRKQNNMSIGSIQGFNSIKSLLNSTRSAYLKKEGTDTDLINDYTDNIVKNIDKLIRNSEVSAIQEKAKEDNCQDIMDLIDNKCRDIELMEKNSNIGVRPENKNTNKRKNNA